DPSSAGCRSQREVRVWQLRSARRASTATGSGNSTLQAARADRLVHLGSARMAGVSTRHPEPHHLGALIRDRRDEILARWERRVRALPHARKLDQPRLVDHIPQLLDRIASMADARGRDPRPELGKRVSTRHAMARLEEGFDLLEVIDEFGALREVLR